MKPWKPIHDGAGLASSPLQLVPFRCTRCGHTQLLPALLLPGTTHTTLAAACPHCAKNTFHQYTVISVR